MMAKTDAAPDMIQITIYTKPGCHLSDDLLASLHDSHALQHAVGAVSQRQSDSP
jgi:hypothetical protein